MHMMKTYETLCTKLEREVAEIAEKELKREDVEDLHHILKNLCLLNQLKDDERMYEDGSSAGYSYGRMRVPHMGTVSYGQWGRDGDGDGGYNESRDNFRNSSYNSYTNGYSRDNANRKMIQKLETLKDDTMSERERMAIDNCIADISR